MELKTLSVSDPSFKSYLLGTFSKTERAIPVKSLNVNSQSETVTFRIVDVASLQMPKWFVRWAQIFKLRTFVLVAFPLAMVLIRCQIQYLPYDPTLAVSSILAALFLHAAVNLRNDFRDHVVGLDRIHPLSGSRAIQNGWITANKAKRLSEVFLLLGVLCGIPSLIGASDELLGYICVVALLMIFGFSSHKMGLKYRYFMEWAAFLLLGPFLTFGFQLSIGMHQPDEIPLATGIVTGWIAVYLLQLKNFEQILVNNQIGFQNTVTWLGFEKSKKFLAAWWLVLCVLMVGDQLMIATPLWTGLMMVFLLIISIMVLKTLKTISSPVGSAFSQGVARCRKYVFYLMCFWLVENLTMLLISEFA